MKIKDYISKIIQEYPVSFKSKTYEESKLKVLNYIFFTNGTGLAFAETEKPEQSGYIVSPKYKDIHGAYVRIKDKPYGKEKYPSFPKNYFDSIVYYVYSTQRPDVKVRKNDYETNVYFMFSKSHNKFNKPALYEALNKDDFHPHPIDKGFCRAADVLYEDVFLQDDWMTELIFLCKKTLDYFNDENQFKHHVNYPNDIKINTHIKIFEKKSPKDIRDLRKTWGYVAKDTCPDYEEIKAHHNKYWERFHKEQKIFLIQLIEKYGK